MERKNSFFTQKKTGFNPFWAKKKQGRFEKTVKAVPWQYVLPAAAGVAGGMYLGSSIGPGFARGVNNFAFGGGVAGVHPYTAPSPQNAAYFNQFH